MKAAEILSPRLGKETPSNEKKTDESNKVSQEVLSWQIECEEYVEGDGQHDSGNGNQACDSSLSHYSVPPMFDFWFSIYFLTLSSVTAPTLP